LTTLSPGAYDDGMRRIRAAASGNEGFRVEVDLKLYVTVGEKVTGE
jgi:hypothetical protein